MYNEREYFDGGELLGRRGEELVVEALEVHRCRRRRIVYLTDDPLVRQPALYLWLLIDGVVDEHRRAGVAVELKSIITRIGGISLNVI